MEQSLLSAFLSKQYSDRYLPPYFLKICRKWPVSYFLWFSLTVSVHKNNKMCPFTDAGSKLRNISLTCSQVTWVLQGHSFLFWSLKNKLSYRTDLTEKQVWSSCTTIHTKHLHNFSYSVSCRIFFGFVIIVAVCLLYLEKVSCLVFGGLFVFLEERGLFVFFLFFFFFHYRASISITQSQFSEKTFILMINACPAH